MNVARACQGLGAIWIVALGIAPLVAFGGASTAVGLCGLVLGAALFVTGHKLGQLPARPAVASSGASKAPAQLLLLLVVAAALRAIGLNSGLWYDEIVTLVEFVRLPPADLVTTYTSTNNHIFFSLLASASVGLFGESAWALRLPAAAFGIASLAAVWWLAHEMAPAREARLATWLVALSYHHVWFSQNARGYTGILLCSWLGSAIFLRARRGGQAELWLAYAVVLGLGMYTHLSAVFVFLAHGLIYLGDEAGAAARARSRGAVRAFDAWPLVGFGLGLLFVAQLYSPLVAQLFATFGEQSGTSSGSAAVTVWKNPLWTVLEIVGGLKLGAASIAVAALGAGMGAVGFVSIARRSAVHGGLIALPPVITLAVLIAIGFNLWPRYFLVSLAFAAIVGMRGLFVAAEWIAGRATGAAAPAWLRKPQTLASAVAVAAIALSAATVVQNYRFPKQDYRGARDFIAAARVDNDAVLVTGLASYSYGHYYEPSWPVLSSLDQLDRLQADHKRVWVVYSFSTHMRATAPDLFGRFERDFEVVKSFKGTLGDGDVHVLRTRGSGIATNGVAS